ncbi:MAG: 3-hydroxyacyl-[acyl-carrier-protein] dehydratase FabZ [Phycisphaerae bacterium]|nr:3-hydroxyacyl-[acyl-carrier-protein] dehydratase FabZ [Phycisphaerae bacterium]
MNRADWLALLPHRPPFLFVDDVVEIGDDAVTTVFRAAPDLAFFSGHFPGDPVMPGVLLCECCLQAGAILMQRRNADADGDSVPVVTRILEAKFKRVVRPGDRLQIHVALDEELGGAFFMTGKASVADETALRCRFAVTRTHRGDAAAGAGT